MTFIAKASIEPTSARLAGRTRVFPSGRRGPFGLVDLLLLARLGGSLGAIVSSPVVDRSTVYVGSMDGQLYAIH